MCNSAYPLANGMHDEPGLICSSMLPAERCWPANVSKVLTRTARCRVKVYGNLAQLSRLSLTSEGKSATSLSHMKRALLIRYSDKLSFTQAIIWCSTAASPMSVEINYWAADLGLPGSGSVQCNVVATNNALNPVVQGTIFNFFKLVYMYDTKGWGRPQRLPVHTI